MKERSSKLENILVLYVSILESPDPGRYNLRSEFDIGRPGTTNTVTKPCLYSFGIGRKYYEKVYSPQNKITNDPNIPGPGCYDQSYQTVEKNKGKHYKMQGRSKNV